MQLSACPCSVMPTVWQVGWLSDDLGFLVGAMLAWALLPLLVLTFVAQRPLRRLLLVGVSIGVVGGMALVGHWVVWLLAFDDVQGEPVPNPLFPATTALMWASAAACGVLAALLVFVAARRIHLP